jgi:hypothetical protein
MTMRTLLRIGAAMLALAVVLVGIGTLLLRTLGTSGPAGPESRLIATERRPLDGMPTKVEVSGPINLTLRQGPAASLEVRGEQRVLANVDTTEDGDTVHIGPRGLLLRARQPIEAVLTLPALEALTVAGTGEHTASGFAGQAVDIEQNGSGSLRFNGRYRDINVTLHGSGDLELTGGTGDSVAAEAFGAGRLTLVGATRELRATLGGSGDLDARHLQADTAHLEHQGAGRGTLYARKRVDIELTGSGGVTVYGDPDQKNVDRTGSGGVTFRDGETAP